MRKERLEGEEGEGDWDSVPRILNPALAKAPTAPPAGSEAMSWYTALFKYIFPTVLKPPFSI